MVGGVEGDTAGAGFGVECTAGCNKTRNIGNGVPDSIAVLVAFGRERLVEINTSRRINRQQSQIGPVNHVGVCAGRYERTSSGYRLGLGNYCLRKRCGHFKLTPDCSKPLLQFVVEGLPNDSQRCHSSPT